MSTLDFILQQMQTCCKVFLEANIYTNFFITKPLRKFVQVLAKANLLQVNKKNYVFFIGLFC
jgi:hypothetical protein